MRLSSFCNAQEQRLKRWLADIVRRSNPRLRAIRLEDRRLPDASFALVSGVLTLDGFDGGDSLSILTNPDTGQHEFSLEHGTWQASDASSGSFNGSLSADLQTLYVGAAEVDAIFIRGGDSLSSSGTPFDSSTGLRAVTDGATGLAVSSLTITDVASVQLESPFTDLDQISVSSEAVVIHDVDDLEIHDLSATTASIHVDGRLTDAVNSSITVSGHLSLYADEIEIGELNTDHIESGTLSFESVRSVSIEMDSTMTLDGISSGSSIELSTTGALHQGESPSSLLTGDTIRLTADGDIGDVTNPLRINANELTTWTSDSSEQSIRETDQTRIDTMDAPNGAIHLFGGQFILDGEIEAESVSVIDSATLSGAGSTAAITQVLDGGTLSPGNSPEIIDTGDFVLNAGSTLLIEVEGPIVGTQYDQVRVTGSVTLAGQLDLAVANQYNPAANTRFLIINNDGTDPVSGTFLNLAEGSVVNSNGKPFLITYRGGDGNDVVLYAGLPTYAFSASSYSVTEGNSGVTSHSITLLRGGNTQLESSVDVSIERRPTDSASTTDFTSEQVRVSFAKGATSATFNVKVTGDRIVESNETFTLRLNTISSGGQPGPFASVVILNDDTAVLTSSGITLTEGDSGTKNANFFVSLSAAVQGGLTVSYETQDGTALSSGPFADYVSRSGTLSFTGSANESRTLSVPILGDQWAESNEAFTLRLFGITVPGQDPVITASVSVSSNPITITLTNDDTPVLAQIVSGNLVVTDEVQTGADNRLTLTTDSTGTNLVIRSDANNLGTGTATAANQLLFPLASITGDIRVQLRGGVDSVVLDGHGLGNLFVQSTPGTDLATSVTGWAGRLLTTSSVESITIQDFQSVHRQTPGSNDIVTIRDSGGSLTPDSATLSITGISQGSPLAEIQVRNIDLLKVDTTTVDGSDQITLESASGMHGVKSLEINTGSGGDTTEINGGVVLSGSLQVDSDEILISTSEIHTGSLQSFLGLVTLQSDLELDSTLFGTQSGGSIFVQQINAQQNSVSFRAGTGDVTASHTLNVFGLVHAQANSIVLHDSSVFQLGTISATTLISLSSAQSFVSLTSTGTQLQVAQGTLSLAAGGDIGTEARPIRFDANRVQTSSANGSTQHLSELNVATIATLEAPGGTINLTSGTFVVDCTSLSSGRINVLTGAVLAGNGTLNSDVHIENGGTLTPGWTTSSGISTGQILVNSLTIGAGATFDAEFSGVTAGTGFDQIVTNGRVTLSGNLSLAASDNFSAPPNTVLQLISNDGIDAVEGTFAGLPEGAVLELNGNPFIISYEGGDGNDVVLVSGAPTYNFSQAIYSTTEGDSGTTYLTVTVIRDTVTAVATTISVVAERLPGDSASLSDFIAETILVAFLPGQTQAHIEIGIVGDRIVEANETFSLSMENFSSGGTAGTRNPTSVVTILNDDTAVLSTNAVRISEGDTGTRTVELDVTLTNDVQGGVSVAFATQDGSATSVVGPFTDYLTTSGSLTFQGAANEVQTITVQVSADNWFEADETFRIQLSGVSALADDAEITDSVTIENEYTTITLVNDDTPILVRSENGRLTITDEVQGGADNSLTISLDQSHSNLLITSPTAILGTGSADTTASLSIPLATINDISIDLRGGLDLLTVRGDNQSTLLVRPSAQPSASTELLWNSETFQLSSVERMSVATFQSVTYEPTGDATLVSVSDGADLDQSTHHEALQIRATRDSGLPATDPQLSIRDVNLLKIDGSLSQSPNRIQFVSASGQHHVRSIEAMAQTADGVIEVDGDLAFEGHLTFTAPRIELGDLDSSPAINITTGGFQSYNGHVFLNSELTLDTTLSGATAGGQLFAERLSAQGFLMNITAGAGDILLSNRSNDLAIINASGDLLEIADQSDFQIGHLTGLTVVSLWTGGSFVGNAAVPVAIEVANGQATLSAELGIGTQSTPVTIDAAFLSTKSGEGLPQHLSEANRVTLKELTAEEGTIVLHHGEFVMTTESVVVATNVSVLDGAVLSGFGTTSASVTVEQGGRISPGGGAGSLGTGALSLNAGSNFVVEVGGSTGGVTFDQLNVTGTVNLAGKLDVGLINGFVPQNNTPFVIINNDGADVVRGTFEGIFEGQHLIIDGQSFVITYKGGDGNDVMLASGVPIYDFASPRTSVIEGNSPITIHEVVLNRINNTLVETTVDVIVHLDRDDTAFLTDFVSQVIPLRFAAGQTSATFQVQIVGDNIVEGTETFSLSLQNFSSGGFAGLISPAAKVNILNDDSAVLRVTTTPGLEGDGGQRTAVVDVTLSAPVQGGLQLSFETLDGTAISAGGPFQDYLSKSGILSFVGNQLETQTVSISVSADNWFESDEHFSVRFFDQTPGDPNVDVQRYVSISGSPVRVDLINDDTPVLVELSNGQLVITDEVQGGADNRLQFHIDSVNGLLVIESPLADLGTGSAQRVSSVSIPLTSFTGTTIVDLRNGMDIANLLGSDLDQLAIKPVDAAGLLTDLQWNQLSIRSFSVEAFAAANFMDVRIQPQGLNDHLTVSDDNDVYTGPGAAALLIEGTTGPQTIAQISVRDSAVLTIDTTLLDGDDIVEILSAKASHGVSSFFVETGVGNDRISIEDNLTFTGELNLQARETSIDAAEITTGSNLTITSNILTQQNVILDSTLNGQRPGGDILLSQIRTQSFSLTFAAGAGDIRAEDSTNELGLVDARGDTIRIADSGDFETGLLQAETLIHLISAGTITDSNGSQLNFSAVHGIVQLQAAGSIGASTDDALYSLPLDVIEIEAGSLSAEAGDNIAIELLSSTNITRLSGDTAYLASAQNTVLQADEVTLRNLSLLLEGAIELTAPLTVAGDLRIEVDSFEDPIAQLSAQRAIIRSNDGEVLTFESRPRTAGGLPGTPGSDPGQLDLQTGGQLTLHILNDTVLTDLNNDGAALNSLGHGILLSTNDVLEQAAGQTLPGNSRILASELGLAGTGRFLLNNAANDVDRLAAAGPAEIVFHDTDELTISTVGRLSGLNVTNRIHIETLKNLNIERSLVAANGIEDTTSATGEVIELYSKDGNIIIDGYGQPVTVSTDENPLRSNQQTGDRIDIRADFDRTAASNRPGTTEGQLTLIGAVELRTDGGVARQFTPRPVPGLAGTAFFFFQSNPLPVTIDNSPAIWNSLNAYINGFRVLIGVAGEENLVINLDWQDPVEEPGVARDPSIQAQALQSGIDHLITSERLQTIFVSQGGTLNDIAHLYSSLDLTLIQQQQQRTLIPVDFSVSQHTSINIQANTVEQEGVLEAVAGRQISSTDNVLTGDSQFENGLVVFTIPTVSPAPAALFMMNSTLVQERPFTTPPRDIVQTFDRQVVADFGGGGAVESAFGTEVYLQIRRQFVVNGPAEIVVARITDSRILSSKEAFEQFVLEQIELQDGSGYEIWMITDTGGKRVERPIVQFEITGGRPGPAFMIEEEAGEPALQDIPFELPNETEEAPVTPPANEPANNRQPDAQPDDEMDDESEIPSAILLAAGAARLRRRRNVVTEQATRVSRLTVRKYFR